MVGSRCAVEKRSTDVAVNTEVIGYVSDRSAARTRRIVEDRLSRQSESGRTLQMHM